MSKDGVRVSHFTQMNLCCVLCTMILCTMIVYLYIILLEHFSASR